MSNINISINMPMMPPGGMGMQGMQGMGMQQGMGGDPMMQLMQMLQQASQQAQGNPQFRHCQQGMPCQMPQMPQPGQCQGQGMPGMLHQMGDQLKQQGACLKKAAFSGGKDWFEAAAMHKAGSKLEKAGKDLHKAADKMGDAMKMCQQLGMQIGGGQCMPGMPPGMAMGMNIGQGIGMGIGMGIGQGIGQGLQIGTPGMGITLPCMPQAFGRPC